MKQLKDDIRELFNNAKDLHRISREMQKTVFTGCASNHLRVYFDN